MQPTTPRRTALVGVVQCCATDSKEANFLTNKEHVLECKSRGAVFVFFPENCTFIGSSPESKLKAGEDLDGELVQRYQQLAKEEKIWISIGGILLN